MEKGKESDGQLPGHQWAAILGHISNVHSAGKDSGHQRASDVAKCVTSDIICDIIHRCATTGHR